MTATQAPARQQSGQATIRTFDAVVLRQDGPAQSSYWERHTVEYEADMNCISVLQKIAARGLTAEGKRVAPVAWDCNCLEEVCGACTMVINGHVRQACTALVDKLLAERPGEIELRPMGKFPVVRDLVVDRSRMFETMKKVEAWLPVDSYDDLGPGTRQSQEQQQIAYELSKCMTCGCCLEACPQYLKIDLTRQPGESDEEFHRRQREEYDRSFMGAFAIAMVDMLNSNPIGAMNAGQRLDALISEGGIQVCGNAQNCVRVCPKEIPLTTSIGRMGRAATLHTLKKIFDR